MFLSAYAFAGSPDTLVARYHRMLETFPADEILLNVCVTTDSGITVYDGCPTQREAEEWAAGEQYHAALRAADLPLPEVTPLGEIHLLVAQQSITA
jgi:hypothetical protein